MVSGVCLKFVKHLTFDFAKVVLPRLCLVGYSIAITRNYPLRKRVASNLVWLSFFM